MGEGDEVRVDDAEFGVVKVDVEAGRDEVFVGVDLFVAGDS